jgi:hypothetical protein
LRTRSFTAPAALLTGALLLSACGGDSPLEGKTGEEVAELAADALVEAGSVRVTGEMTDDGQTGEIDLRLEGDDAAGTITMDGVEVEIISVDGTAYLRGTEDLVSMLGLPADAAGEIEGKWIELPGDAAADFEDFSLEGIADELRSPDDAKDETVKDELDGDDVVIVEQEDGKSLVVKDDDPAYPLEMRGGGDSEGTLTFSEHGEGQDIEAPEDIADLESILGG